jgi:gamma-carbonic anhydrase
VWYGAVLRGDNHSITVGSHTNIQDKVVINNTQELETDLPPEVVIEDHVTIGHGAVLTSCHIQDHAVIGMNAVIGTGCFVGRNSMIAAGAVLLPGTFVPAGQLWAGNPAVYIRDIRAEEIHSFDQVRPFSSFLLAPLSD